jgi:putative peptidoglycan lipid II flippase
MAAQLEVAAPEAVGDTKDFTKTARLRVGTSASISLVLLIGGLLELFKNSAIAYRYGSGRETDAFFAAYLIPITYSMFWVSACLVGLVPFFSRWLGETEEKFRDIVSGVLWFSTSLTLVLTSIGYIAAPLVVKLLVPGFTGAQKLLTIHLFRELAVLFLLVGFTGVATALLNTHYRFLLAAAQKIVVNVVVFGGLFLWYANKGIEWLAQLIVLGTLFHVGLLLVQLWRSGLGPRLKWTLSSAQMRSVLAALFVPFAAYMIRQSNIVAERVIGSFLPAGSISALTYSYQVILGFSSVIIAGVTTVLIPMFAQQKSQAGKLTLLWDGFYYLLVLTLPLSFGGYLLARPLVLILFHHGAFSAASVEQTTQVFKAYALSPFFGAISVHFLNLFWADRQYRLLITHNGLMALLNILLDLALAPLWGATGLALGSTVANVASCVRLYRLAGKHYGSLLDGSRLFSALKPLGATLIMTVVVLALRVPVSTSVMFRQGQLRDEIVGAVVLAGAGFVTYLAAGIAARMEPFPTLYRSLALSFRFQRGKPAASG